MSDTQPAIDAQTSMPLSLLGAWQEGTIAASPALTVDEAASLRAMGLRPGARVRIARVGQPTIVQIVSCGGPECGQCGCRLGLARNVAERVLVVSGAVRAS